VASKKIPQEALEFFRKQGSKGGKLSAEARMRKLTPEQRSDIARKAVAAREAKRNVDGKSATLKRKAGKPR
jgi:hypothetical protein